MTKISNIKKMIINMWLLFTLINLIPITIVASINLFPRAEISSLLGYALIFTIVVTLLLFGILYCFINEQINKRAGLYKLLSVAIFIGIFYLVAGYIFFVAGFTKNGSGYIQLLLLLIASFLVSVFCQSKSLQAFANTKL